MFRISVPVSYIAWGVVGWQVQESRAGRASQIAPPLDIRQELRGITFKFAPHESNIIPKEIPRKNLPKIQIYRIFRVEITSKQRRNTYGPKCQNTYGAHKYFDIWAHKYFDVVSTLFRRYFDVVSMCFDVISTLFRRCFDVFRRYFDVKLGIFI